MSATTLPAFTFEGSNVRVFMINNEPWFAATDVARCIGIKDPKDAVKNLRSCERSGFKPERGGSLTIISESGMYTMVLRSDAAIKEGTAAFRFRVWVTDEVLPAIRKQGKYECPIATLTPAQQLQLREAVAKRAKAVSAHYHTIYRALYARFQVPRYTEILAKDFGAALDFIRTVDLRVPTCTPAKKEVSQACPTCGLRPVPQGSVILHPDECRALATFIYYVRYLFRGCLLKFADTLIAFNAPEAGRFYEAVTASTYVTIERALVRRGYTVSQNGISLPQPQKQHKQITC